MNTRQLFRCLLIICTFILLLQPAFSQYSIKGTLTDSVEGKPLIGAHVFLFQNEDSLEHVTISSKDGSFIFTNLSSDVYRLKFSFVGHETMEKECAIQDKDIDLGTITLPYKENPIEEVEVVDNVKSATLIGDTLQFNADAYKTMPDASATDLAKKLPGVVIENNKVQAQGEDVNEVLVDGRPFFGYDPSTALNTLPAEVVDKIQIFDKESDQAEFTGFSSGETSKTMNIITRARMRNGSFGKFTAGYGLDNKYMVNGNYNIFNGSQRISFIAQSNNINQQNFAFEDLLGVVAGGARRSGMLGGGDRRGGGRGFGVGGRGSVSDFMVPGQGGITTTHAAGVNYSDRWGEKLEVSGSYFFNLSDNTSEERVYREYLLAADSGQIYEELGTSDSKNINHRFSGKLEYTINDNNSILYRPRITFQQNDGNSAFLGQTSLNEMLINDIDNTSRSELEAMSVSNNLLYRHKFSARGRTFSINLGNSWSQNHGNKYLMNTTRFFTPVDEFDMLDQNSLLETDSWSVNSNMVYTEPAGENGLLQLNYSLGYMENRSDQETNNFNQETNSYILFDTLLSNTFDNNYLTHRLGSSMQYRKGLFMVNAGISYQHASMQNSQLFPVEFDFEKNYNNLLFNGMLRFGKSRMNSFSLRYNSSTDNPSISQLQDVIDNSDPLQLRTGNPDIDQSRVHRVFMRYSAIKPEKSRVFFIMLGTELRQDYIGNQTLYARKDMELDNGYILKEGTQLTRPVNLDGYANLRSFITYGIPVTKLKLNLNFNLSVSYSRRPGLVNEDTNYSNTWMGGLGVMISSNISEYVDFGLFSQSGFNSVTNSQAQQQNTNYFSQSTRFNFKWIVFKSLVLETNVSNMYYNGLSSALDQNFVIMNAAIGKKIFRNKLGEIKLSVYDLFNQNKSLQRNVSDIYIEDNETLALQRFFMISFTYNLRNFSMEMPDRPFWGPPGMRGRMGPHMGGGGMGPGGGIQ